MQNSREVSSALRELAALLEFSNAPKFLPPAWVPAARERGIPCNAPPGNA
jgi:hypothetical protein